MRRKPEGYDDMTRDELLAEIGDNSERTNNALRAVVELHKPEMYVEVLRCGGCEDMPEYPCYTIKAIEKELK